MGKRSKQGAALRAKKRADIANQQLEQAMADMGEQSRVQSKKDEELFVLDTAQQQSAATNQSVADRKRAEKESSKKRKVEHSERHARKIQKVLKNHGTDGAIALAAKGQARLEQRRIRKQISAASNKPTFDLWGEAAATSKRDGRNNKARAATATATTLAADPAFDPPTQPQSKLSNKQLKARKQAEANAPPKLAVEVAHPGQSYHPDREHHQDAIGEALSIEIRRNDAVEYKARPISEGMSAYTKEFLVNSDDEEDDSSDEEEEDNEEATNGKIIKRKEKLTRAQRNKQKRVKAEQTSLKERRTKKQFLHQVNEVHIHNKVVKKTEQEQADRQQEMQKLKKEKQSRPLGKGLWSTLSERDPIRAPSLPVALTSELLNKKDGESSGGGLRTIAPKGSLVTDRLESMVARNMISKKKVGGRRIVQGKKRNGKVRGAQGTEYLLI